MRTLALLSALFLIAGCGDEDPDAAAGSDGPTLSSVTVDESVEEDACAVLTPTLVSEATGAPAGLEGNGFMKGMCAYGWDDENHASIGELRVYDDAERAGRMFAQHTATVTRGDMRAGFDAMGDVLESQRESGEVSDEQAEGVGAMTEAFEDVAVGEGDDDEVMTSYEPVSGIGDEAAIDESESMGEYGTDYQSTLWVRRGNAIFAVRALMYGPDGEFDRAASAEATRALGRAVAAALDS